MPTRSSRSVGCFVAISTRTLPRHRLIITHEHNLFRVREQITRAYDSRRRLGARRGRRRRWRREKTERGRLREVLFVEAHRVFDGVLGGLRVLPTERLDFLALLE